MAWQQPTSNPVRHRFEGVEMWEIAKYAVNVKDAFNLSYLYLMLHDWLIEEGWGSRKDHEFGEDGMIQRDHPQFGKEIWLYWRIKKTPPAGGGLFKYLMDIDWHILGLKNTEIVWKGQKVETNKGEFEIGVTAYILIDSDKKWKGWPWSDIKKVMLNRTYKRQAVLHKKEVYTTAYRMRDLVMNYMKMETFMPIKEAGEFYLKRSYD